MMTREEILKLRPEFAELIARRPPLPPKKPAPSAVVPLGEKLAEVAKANPTGLEVRVTARSGDGTTYVDPPKRPTELFSRLRLTRRVGWRALGGSIARLAKRRSWNITVATGRRQGLSMSTIQWRGCGELRMSEAAVARRRDWLSELKKAEGAADIDVFTDLLTIVAVEAPELKEFRECDCAGLRRGTQPRGALAGVG